MILCPKCGPLASISAVAPECPQCGDPHIFQVREIDDIACISVPAVDRSRPHVRQFEAIKSALETMPLIVRGVVLDLHDIATGPYLAGEEVGDANMVHQIVRVLSAARRRGLQGCIVTRDPLTIDYLRTLKLDQLWPLYGSVELAMEVEFAQKGTGPR